MKEINKIIDGNEQILWEGKPTFLPFFIGSIGVSVFGLIFMLFGLIPLVAAIASGQWLFIFFPHFWIGLALFIGVPLYRYLVYKYIYYAITDKRVILQSGLIGRDFDMVDFDKITNSDVNVGVIDKVFGASSGTISIYTAGTFVRTKQGTRAKPYQFLHVPHPYDVFKQLKKVSHDVKTDIEYPNAMRPNHNPGYKTRLKRK